MVECGTKCGTDGEINRANLLTPQKRLAGAAGFEPANAGTKNRTDIASKAALIAERSVFPKADINGLDGKCGTQNSSLNSLADDGKTVAALYVEPNGPYFEVAGVQPWPAYKDARLYSGPHPVVAHPPCERWGRFWHGSTRKPHQYKLGADDGCFAAALASVRAWGGVLEHPADSKAWQHFGLNRPARGGGWIAADTLGGFTCYVEQGHYGHASRKPTWLYAVGVDLPELDWSRGEQRIPQWMLDRYGYEKARRIGVVAMVGGKHKKRIRNMTPEPFRDLLLSIARTARLSTPYGESAEGIGR